MSTDDESIDKQTANAAQDSSILSFTGERFTPEKSGIMELEHKHRYLFALQAVEGKSVLDIASGEGYGSSILAGSARTVVGVDISEEAVAHAKNKYAAENLEFRVGSCSAIPVEDQSIDVVVSFETIEHHDEHEVMMQEIKRVLSPNGLLIISSPDKYVHSEKKGYVSPWHVKELYRSEFDSILETNFENHRLYGQRVVYGSLLTSETEACLTESFVQTDNSNNSYPGLSEPLFWLALASDDGLPDVKVGLFEQPIEDSDLQRAYDAERTARATEQAVRTTEQEEARKQIDALTKWATSADEYAKSLVEEMERLRGASGLKNKIKRFMGF